MSLLEVIDKSVMRGSVKFYERHATPVFKSDVERVRYWTNEKVRWIEGYGDISGMYYHFLQEQRIKHRVTGKLLIPKAFESDYILYDEIERCRRDNTPVLVIKARATRFSTYGGSAINYYMRAHPGTTCLVTSADQARITKLYSDKIRLTHDNYHKDIQYRIVNESKSSAKTYLKIGIHYKDDDGQVRYGESDVYCNQTSNSDSSAASFSGLGAIFGFYDELALNPRRSLLLQSSGSCYIDPDTSERVGMLVAGGTVEHTLTNEDLGNFVSLYNSWISRGWRVIFLPYWYRFHDENGYLDRDSADRWYETEYKNASNSGDSGDLQAFLKNNPGSIDDVLNMGGTGFFNELSVERLRSQRSKIIINSKDTLYRLSDGVKMEAFPDVTGKYLIHEHPKEGVVYNMVIDGVATGSDYGSGNSKVAAIMIKQFDPATQLPFETVASMEYRPQSLEQTFPLLLDFAKYYNRYGKFGVMHPEASNSTHELLPQYMIKEGYIHWLKRRVDYSKGGNIDVRKFGQPMNNHSIPYAVGRWNELLSKYVEGLTMVNIIDDMLKPESENADIRSAMLLYAFLLEKDYDKPKILSGDRYRIVPRIVYKNGKSDFVFEKIKY